MPDNEKTRRAVAKANGKLARAKADKNPDAMAKARKGLEAALKEYDKD
jgi:hypothetical protein